MTHEPGAEVIVLNAGSGTVKGALLEFTGSDCQSRARITRSLPPGAPSKEVFEEILDYLGERAGRVAALGHRVVHGGSRFVATTEVDSSVEEALEALSSLAPLHNPLALAGIRAGRERFPSCPQFGVFDTAFHAHRDPVSMRYPLPRGVCEELALQRTGFHGIAHAALTQDLARETGLHPHEVTAVTLQLGSGCSACAVERGRSIETSMGVSPLGGLPMATRTGDLDPGVILALLRSGWSPDRIEHLLTREGGLEGLTGRSNMQDVQFAMAAGDPEAALAIEHFVRAVVMLTGAYLTLLRGEGAVVFGGGIGTNSHSIRERIAEGLAGWGVDLDVQRNRASHTGRISKPETRPVYVFETDEERLIGREVYLLLSEAWA